MGAFDDLNKDFAFLESDYGYTMVKQINKPAYNLIEYENTEIRRMIFLEANTRENHFLFAIANTVEMKPNWEQDIWKQNKNVVTFFDIFKKYESNLVFADFDMGANYGNKAVEKNIQFLKMYGDKVLRGIEWL